MKYFIYTQGILNIWELDMSAITIVNPNYGLLGLEETKKDKEVTSTKGKKGKPVVFATSTNPQKTQPTPTFWDENTRAILYNITQNTGIAPYKPTVLKDDNTAIQHAQNHLIDLLKYYEGDKYYYYEAITTPYKDTYGNWTCGFGELTNKPRTQETAYKHLGETIEQYAGEVKRLLNARIGKKTYENLPNSIKEGLIDLCYNKGLSKISQNKTLMNALKNKDYSTVIDNLDYVYSGKTNAEKEENAGLYRRSFNRMILATRDLKGKELEEAKKVINKFYLKALNCHKNNHIPTVELDKINENYKTGKISIEPKSAESTKIKVTNKYKGKGLYSVAQDAYNSIEDKGNITFKEFYKEFKKANRETESIILGTELNVPSLNNLKAQKEIAQKIENGEDFIPLLLTTAPKTTPTAVSKPLSQTDTTVKANETMVLKADTSLKNQEETSVEKEGNEEQTEKTTNGFWQKLGKAFPGILLSFGAFIFSFLNLFAGCSRIKDTKTLSNMSDEDQSKLQKMLDSKNVKITQDGDLYMITGEHTVQKGETIWKISRQYDIDENILCANNNIKNKNQISEGQTLNIQKLGYKVQKGENLFRIAKKFGLTVEILKDVNNIVDADKINTGQMLEIPGFIYTVQPKDTLFAISKRVGVKLEDLIKLNNLDKNGIITPGQKIKVIYNDSDFAISADKKKITVDKTTNTTTEIVNMSGVVKLDNRDLLKQKRKINGKVVATRAEFNPTKSGPLSGKTIIINAGHGYSQGGIDAGTVGLKGLEDEWLINYDNSMRLKDELCAKGAKVIFLQGHRRLILSEIKKSSNKADMFISVHVNSHDKATQDRTQVYYARQTQSKKLAQIMENKFDKWIPQNETIADKDKFTFEGKQDYAQSKQANYDVLRAMEKNQNKPSVLWEVAFMVSPKGRERMKNPELMKDYAQCMTDAVVEYFKNNKA